MLATELLGTAPPLDSHNGNDPEDERAAEVCPPQSDPPQTKRYDDARDHFHVLPFHGGTASEDSESQPGTAPPVETSQQSGMSEVRVADKEAASLQVSTTMSGKPQDDHIPQQTVKAHAERPEQQSLNPEADSFVMRDANLVYGGHLRPDLDQDWESVQEAHAGRLGHDSGAASSLWGFVHPEGVPQSGQVSGGASCQEELSIVMDGNLGSGAEVPAKPLLRASSLKDRVIRLPDISFIDKVLPAPAQPLVQRDVYSPEYFQSLHNLVAASGIRSDGSTYPALTPNYMGARIKLQHVGMKADRWRYHLRGYEHVDIVQHLEYGFPLGLEELPELRSSVRNHGSSYAFYTHVDKFIADEIRLGGMTGPFDRVPWWDAIISPMMTAPKKPSSRRTVFDASFGDYSLNNSTPGDMYLGQPCVYTYPKIDDFRRMILRCGRRSYLFKRDLSRFFLQIPLDPVEYHRVGLIWRGLIFFFIGLAFGLRHSGLQGQKLTDALSWIHRRQGLDTPAEKQFNVVNYSDDLGGCEAELARAIESFNLLKVLMDDLGLDESLKKAEAPSQEMVYLGVMFDTKRMEMRVPPDKLSEIKSEIGSWSRKSTITRRNLQSLLGKLFWVSKVVRLARIFMGRLLQQLRDMSTVGENTKVKLSLDSRRDLRWWSKYLEHFNGIQMIIEEDPFPLELSQMLDRPHEVYAGDATPVGGGGWHGKEYWSQLLPRYLQDPATPIHIKEFWVLVVSARLWGQDWTGRAVTLFCDNEAVVQSINHKKPKDQELLSLLREFFFIAVSFKFIPVVRRISTKDNFLADFISRRFDSDAASQLFRDNGLPDMVKVVVPDKSFKLSDSW